MTATQITVLFINRYFSTQNDSYTTGLDLFNYIKDCLKKKTNKDLANIAEYAAHLEENFVKSLKLLAQEKKIYLTGTHLANYRIILLEFVVAQVEDAYRNILKSPSLPLPLRTIVPRYVPSSAIATKDVAEYFEMLVEEKKFTQNVLYSLTFPYGIPPLLISTSITFEALMQVLLCKLQHVMDHELVRDTLFHRISGTNAGRRDVVSRFFTQLIHEPNNIFSQLQLDGTGFSLWNQLCYFFKAEFENIKVSMDNSTTEFHVICLIEYAVVHFHTVHQKKIQIAEALTELDLQLSKPPYFFTYETIAGFTNSNGVALLSLYQKTDLDNYIKRNTSSGSNIDLPQLLTFKLANDSRQYIQKANIIPLISHLYNDTREAVHDKIASEWEASLRAYKKPPAMKDQQLFEKELLAAVKVVAPIFYALLTTPFLFSVYAEAQLHDTTSLTKIPLFHRDTLLPYSEILVLPREKIAARAKIAIPFWYSAPVLSWILTFLHSLKIKDTLATTSGSKEKQKQNEKDTTSLPTVVVHRMPEKATSNSVRKEVFKKAAEKLEGEFVPAGSTLNRELVNYEEHWNRLLDQTAHDNLTTDINSFIRNQLQQSLKFSHNSLFTKANLQSLAETITYAPNLSKVTDKDHFHVYVQLYIIWLLKNQK